MVAWMGLAGAWAQAAAPAVEVKDGNIVLRTAAGEAKTLTTSGKDSAPVISPDGKWIVFVRAVPGKKVATGSGEYEAQELWQIDAAGKEPVLMAASRDAEKMEDVIAIFRNVQFSTDGRLVFFDTPAWATSGAVHVVDTTNRKQRFVVAGDGVKVIRSGEYKDCLLLGQHRYFIGGGSYDWLWLFRADGTEIGPVGEDATGFMELYFGEEAAGQKTK